MTTTIVHFTIQAPDGFLEHHHQTFPLESLAQDFVRSHPHIHSYGYSSPQVPPRDVSLKPRRSLSDFFILTTEGEIYG